MATEPGQLIKTLLSNGNMKVGDDTLIFNMNAAVDCPADELGLCPVFDICYARKAERQYRDVLNYRRLQEEVWKMTGPGEFVAAFVAVAKSKSRPVLYFRFSESGDFESQADVDKMAEIARLLSLEGIKTYGYTARRDLCLEGLREFAVVNGSGFMASNEFRAVPEFTKKNLRCPGDCRGCTLCKRPLGRVIEVEVH